MNPREMPFPCGTTESSSTNGGSRGDSVSLGGSLPPGSRDLGFDCPACTGTTDEHDVDCSCGAEAEAACRGCGRGLGYAVRRGTLAPDSCFRCRNTGPDGPFLVSDEAPEYDPQWDTDPVEPRQSLA